MPRYDAILIPGGGVREEGDLPLWTKRRLDRAIETQRGEFIITLSAGTLHRPPPSDADGFPIFESIAAAAYLVRRGIEPRRILAETCSYDTIGNAFFSRVVHVDPLGLRKLLIITSEFHMARSREIFLWIYGLDSPATGYTLSFDSVSDDGIEEAALAARREKEYASLQHVLAIQSRVRTLQQFHEWLFAEHAAYSVHSRPTRLTGNILDTY